MVFKSDISKKKLFAKYSIKRMLKHIIPITVFFILFTDFILLGMDVPEEHKRILLKLILPMNVFLMAISFLCVILSLKMIQKYFENWELDIEDTYAIVKNTIANTTVNFSDIKSYKETKGTVTYRLGFVKRFYIHWETYENSDELKKQLDAISSKIGTFEKHETTESIKTGVRCSQTYMIFIIGIVVVIAVVKILERLC